MEKIIPFFLAVLLKDLHHNGDAFLEDHMGLRWLEQSEEDPLVYQTGHRDDRNSPKCIIGKVQIIKDGNNFCLSCLEEQRLVALLQGSVESDDSPASGGDEEEGEQAQADNVSEPITFEAGLKDLQPDMSPDNLQWLLTQEKRLMGLTQKSC